MKFEKRLSTVAFLITFGLAAARAADPDTKKAAGEKEEPKVELKGTQERGSYAFGYNLGKHLSQQSMECDLNALFVGLKDGLSAGKCKLTEAELMEALQAFQQAVTSRQANRDKAAGDKNRKEGDAFLAENKKKPEVVTLPSGLQYQILTKGTGATPKATDKVSTHYRGTLIDGTEFDSSYSRGQPATFPVNRVIKGWTEALQLMPIGSKWKLFIPSDLAYGDRGSPPKIGPNATLIFEVELLGIN